MASDVSICNIAIIRCGHDPIMSLSQAVKAARLCLQLYPEALDVLLRGHPWNWAIRRVELSLSTASPGDDEFQYMHVVPDDCLKILAVYCNHKYRVETNTLNQKVIVSNEEQIFLRYVRRVTDPNRMDPLFRAALSLAIAVPLAASFTDSAKLAADIKMEAEEALKLARSVDAQEGTPEDLQGDDLWLRARDGGGTSWDGYDYR